MARDARRSTLVDIAADAGVSVSAVSKVLNGRTDVAAGTRARIAGLLRQHGYQVASRLGFGVVDLLIADLHSPWAEELLRGTMEAANEAGTSVIVTTVHSPRSSPTGSAGPRRGGPTARCASCTCRAAGSCTGWPRPGSRWWRSTRRSSPAMPSVGRHHQLAGRHDRHPPPDRTGPPPHRHHRRPAGPVVQPGPAGRLSRRPAGRRARRGRKPHPPGRLLVVRRAGAGRGTCSRCRSRPRPSWPATTARRSACSRP